MELPTFDEANAKIEANNFTALDRFVFDNEPDGPAEERFFREGLKALMDFVASTTKADERQRIKYELGTMYGDSVIHGPTLRAVMEPRQ